MAAQWQHHGQTHSQILKAIHQQMTLIRARQIIAVPAQPLFTTAVMVGKEAHVPQYD